MAVKNSCCPSQASKTEESSSCHSSHRRDYLLWGSLAVVVLAYLGVWSNQLTGPSLHFASGVYELMNKMWWGLVFAFGFVGLLERVPREVVMAILGSKKGFQGLLRATLGGLLLDLCNHGILVVGMKLYERGASLGQTIAFLVASPWNSFSLTIILISLVGWYYTLIFVGLSAVVALASGMIFEFLVRRGTLPENPNAISSNENLVLSEELSKLKADMKWSLPGIYRVFRDGVKESQMVLRWIFFGVVLAALVRTIFPAEMFETYFGPSLLGLGFTLIAATVIEVCSEGSTPLASDLVNIGGAPGNGFTFLMAGASTDYTEIMALKETTRSWRVALFLPLVTVPQIVFLGYLLNIGVL